MTEKRGQYSTVNKLLLNEKMMLISVSISEDINTNLWSELIAGIEPTIIQH
jgi:hypothetical protein